MVVNSSYSYNLTCAAVLVSLCRCPGTLCYWYVPLFFCKAFTTSEVHSTTLGVGNHTPDVNGNVQETARARGHGGLASRMQVVWKSIPRRNNRPRVTQSTPCSCPQHCVRPRALAVKAKSSPQKGNKIMQNKAIRKNRKMTNQGEGMNFLRTKQNGWM